MGFPTVALRLLSGGSKRSLLFNTGTKLLASTTSGHNATAATASRKVLPLESFWDKNKRMERPMSPHLTIYKFELPSLLSGTHRATGFAMSGMVLAIGVSSLVLPGNADIYIDIIKSWNLPILLLAPAKFFLAFPLCYHTVNGVRHLAWDTGRGFHMNTLYKTGYTAVAIAVALSASAVAYVTCF